MYITHDLSMLAVYSILKTADAIKERNIGRKKLQLQLKLLSVLLKRFLESSLGMPSL